MLVPALKHPCHYARISAVHIVSRLCAQEKSRCTLALEAVLKILQQDHSPDIATTGHEALVSILGIAVEGKAEQNGMLCLTNDMDGHGADKEL